MSRFGTLHSFQASVVATAVIMAAAPAYADGNKVYILQESGLSNVGNTLLIDQSAATNALVAGSLDGLVPAEQIDGGNLADIVLEGDAATVLLQQNNQGLSGVAGNIATIFGGDLSMIAVQQNGQGNSGEIFVSAGKNTGELFQLGNDNFGTVEVNGLNSFGRLSQEGDRNSFALNVTGNGTSVTYNQIGNDLSTSSGIGPSVYSNGGTVVITQTVLP